MPLGESKKIRKYWKQMEHVSSWSVLMMLIYWAKAYYHVETLRLH